jgi:hypothetical protein
MSMRLFGSADQNRPIRVAAVPEIARIASEWLETSEHPQLGAVGYGRRELAGPEKLEIRRRAVTALPIRLLIVGVTVWLMANALPDLGSTASAAPFVWLVVLGTVCVGACVSTVRAFPMALNMYRDAREGSVTIIRLPLANLAASRGEGGAVNGIEARDDRDHISILEVLTHSRVVWTVDGKQAGWRLT